MLVAMGPTYFDVRLFVGWCVVALFLLLLLLRTSAALQTIGDPNLDVFLVHKELRSRWEGIGVVLFL